MLILIAFILKFMNKNVISEQPQNTSSLLRAKKISETLACQMYLSKYTFPRFPDSDCVVSSNGNVRAV